MRTEFEALKEELLSGKINLNNNQLALLVELENKIIEVEKRIECAVRTNKDSLDVVMNFADAFDDREELTQILSYSQYEILLRGVHDVDVALDLNDTESIDNNWYGLFEEKEEVSNGGIPYRSCYHCSIKEEETVMSQVNGFWLCCDCNDETKEEESVFELDTTKFLPSTFDKVKQVIEILKTIDNGSCIDGETMDYIVKELGFEEYLLRSLVMNADFKDTKDLLREKFELSL